MPANYHGISLLLYVVQKQAIDINFIHWRFTVIKTANGTRKGRRSAVIEIFISLIDFKDTIWVWMLLTCSTFKCLK